MMTKLFIHPALGEEVGSISGHYSFLREEVLTHGGRELLYLIGYALADSACCGTGACVFCHVAGYIVRRREDDAAPTEVEPLTDPAEKDEIGAILKDREGCTQVNFF
ncbi:MAG: hypothetical protein KBA15_00150 [Spirochaetes bacterium]|jgi:hypothetical protein|nr:hypothetical protein [Spirochaetota bacterium]